MPDENPHRSDQRFLVFLQVLAHIYLGTPFSRGCAMLRVDVCLPRSAQARPPSRQPTSGPLNDPGEWDFFLSHTQRDPAAVALAELLYSEFEKRDLSAWLDVKMKNRDKAAMEEGAKKCKCFIAIVTDNGKDSYFSRDFCRAEVEWAQAAERTIVPVCGQADKINIGKFIAEGNQHKLDFGGYNFVVRHAPVTPTLRPPLASFSLDVRRTSTGRHRGGSKPRSKTFSMMRACSPARDDFKATASLVEAHFVCVTLVLGAV